MAELQRTTETLQAEISALKSALQQARQTFKIEVDTIYTQLKHNQTLSSNNHPKSASTNKSHTSGRASTGSQTKSRQTPRSHSPTPTSIKSPCPPSSQNPTASDITISESKSKSHSHLLPLKMTTTSPSPHPLQNVTVANEATVILIGDSTIKGIDLTGFTPPSATPQIMCGRGLTVTGLTDWLNQHTPMRNVKHVTFHVGVNDCRELFSISGASISKQQWGTLIKQCQRMFPSANIQASSIIPAKGRNPINTIIHPSNKQLKETCHTLNVKYTDHCATFTTQSGAPKMALYADAIHPSKRGTVRMAENLFPPRRPPLLKTPPPSMAGNLFSPRRAPLLKTPPPPGLSSSAVMSIQSRHTGFTSTSDSTPDTKHQMPPLLPPPMYQSEYPDLRPSLQQNTPLQSGHQSTIPLLPSSHLQQPPFPHHSVLPIPPPPTPHQRIPAMDTQHHHRPPPSSPLHANVGFHPADLRDAGHWSHMMPHRAQPPPPLVYAERESAHWPYATVYRPMPLPPQPPPSYYLPRLPRLGSTPISWPYFMPQSALA